MAMTVENEYREKVNISEHPITMYGTVRDFANLMESCKAVLKLAEKSGTWDAYFSVALNPVSYEEED